MTFDQFLGFLRILMLVLIGYTERGSFHRERNGDSPANTAVPSCNNRCFARKLSGSLVAGRLERWPRIHL
ncbi:hypothetical protein D3C78_1964250 [compost metagenome]